MADVDLGIEKSFNPVAKSWEGSVFIRFYVSARTSGLLAAMGAENVQTFLAIATFMDGDGKCYPTEEQIAEALGLSRRQVVRRIRQLLAFEWHGRPLVRAVRSRRPDGTWDNLRYTVLPEAPVAFGHPQAGEDSHAPSVSHGQDHVPSVSHGEDHVPSMSPGPSHVPSMPRGTDVTLTRSMVGSSASSGSPSSLPPPTVTSRARLPGEGEGVKGEAGWRQELKGRYGREAVARGLACLRQARARGEVRHPRAFVERAIEHG
ncbi:MAG: helix-turn-helix domain-containing protein [Firmicutes bacterium]|nr:helix-turn-helix domain-containing protein [Bacillota bacterium]